MNILPDKPGSYQTVSGLSGSGRAYWLASVLKGRQTPVVLVVADSLEAAEWQKDLRFFMRMESAVFPSIDVLPYYQLSPQPGVLSDRMEFLFQLSQAKGPSVFIIPLHALLRRTLPRSVFNESILSLEPEAELTREQYDQALAKLAYVRSPLVEDAGTFAVRGGILDVFSPAHADPCRLEFFGDFIESMRFFDPVTQKSLAPAKELHLIPAREILFSQLNPAAIKELKKRCDHLEISKADRDVVWEQMEEQIYFHGIESFLPLFYPKSANVLDYVPAQATLCFSDLNSLRLAHTNYLDELKEHREKSTSLERIFSPEELFLTPQDIKESIEFFPVIDLASIHSSPDLKLNMEPNAALRVQGNREEAFHPLVQKLKEKQEAGFQIHLVGSSPSQTERLADLFPKLGVPIHRVEHFTGQAFPMVQVILGPLSSGFLWEEKHQWWITDEEIFGKKAHRAAPKRAADTFSSFSQLAEGDYIVHEDHGIGVYRGLKLLEVGGSANDFLLLEYLGHDKLYVPAHALDRLSRYTHPEGSPPILDKLGGTTWLKVREKAKKATRQLARELLDLQAKRAAEKGFAFSARNAHFEAFESRFPFDETPDQERAIEDVLGDMESERPMDRLVCGDVGYGKTEVALRAAFKAVLDHKQVAVLVPTTVLAFQHFETFKKRFAGEALRVELLSRFQDASEQKKILADLAAGRVDIVVATHRLLSKDVGFSDLGLLIVDEEHRFGVLQKERIKKLKALVDVLTLTATPIPRTLNFALTQIKDLSIINTPPADRLAIRTYVGHWDEGLIREAITREVHRGGQIFFVHNRVQTLPAIRDQLKQIVPDVTVGMAHGQMPEEELESVMLDFMHHKFQVLLCTTIIESGLDIPNANTMLINRADQLGLAQLYQLRGRVGRSHHRAYCYLLVPADATLTAIAKKRLSVIERFTELGSGFKIASHDLEIRGAGNILGDEQSGHIAAIGYDLYLELLQEAIEELRSSSSHIVVHPELKLGINASIPETLVPDSQLRLSLYKQISNARDDAQCVAIREEWLDRFGKLPDPVDHLVGLIHVKLAAQRLKIQTVTRQKDGVLYHVHPQSPIPVDYFVARAKNHPKRYRILPDGKFFVVDSFKDDADVLQKVSQHLSEMAKQVC